MTPPTTAATPPPSTAASVDETVTIHNGVVHPASLDLTTRSSGIVRFANEDDEPRTLTFRGDLGEFEIGAGDEVAIDFTGEQPGVYRYYVQVGDARSPGLVDTTLLGRPPLEPVGSWDGRVGFEAPTYDDDWESTGLATGVVGTRDFQLVPTQRALATGGELTTAAVLVAWAPAAGDAAATGRSQMAAEPVPRNCRLTDERTVTTNGLRGAEEVYACGADGELVRGYLASDADGATIHYRTAAFTDADRQVAAHARATITIDPGGAPVEPMLLLGMPMLPFQGDGAVPADLAGRDVHLRLRDGSVNAYRLDLGPWHTGTVVVHNDDGRGYDLVGADGPAGRIKPGGQLTLDLRDAPPVVAYTAVGDGIVQVPIVVGTTGLRDPRLVAEEDWDRQFSFQTLAGRAGSWDFTRDVGVVIGGVAPLQPTDPFAGKGIRAGQLVVALVELEGPVPDLATRVVTPAGCEPPRRSEVTVAGRPGQQLDFGCAGGELRAGLVPVPDAGLVLCYEGVIVTDEDR